MADKCDLTLIDGCFKEVHNMTSKGYVAPAKDASSGILSARFEDVPGHEDRWIVRIKRKLDTCDSLDFLAANNSTFVVCWAMKSDD